MIVLDVAGAAAFLGVSTKTARDLILRLPHGDVSRSAGPNRKLVIAQDVLEGFVRGDIQPEAAGREGNVVDIARPRPKTTTLYPRQRRTDTQAKARRASGAHHGGGKVMGLYYHRVYFHGSEVSAP